MSPPSPLEFYQQAYDLHYRQGRLEDAVVLYKKIIQQFPAANECAYAAIQLEKIAADEMAESVNPRRNMGVIAAAIVLFLTVLALGAMQFVLYLRLERSVAEMNSRVRVLVQTLAQERAAPDTRLDSLVQRHESARALARPLNRPALRQDRLNGRGSAGE